MSGNIRQRVSGRSAAVWHCLGVRIPTVFKEKQRTILTEKIVLTGLIPREIYSRDENLLQPPNERRPSSEQVVCVQSLQCHDETDDREDGYSLSAETMKTDEVLNNARGPSPKSESCEVPPTIMKEH